jgi:hypothetical protein
LTKPRVHARHPRFASLTLCNRPAARLRCGEPRSDTTPPVIFLPETKSAHALDCELCLEMWRKALAKPTAT